MTMKLLVWMAAVFLTAEVARESAAAQAPPNILWIVGEDASPHLGCYGESQVRTPHLDRLAAGGIRFTRAVVTSPVCSPSRSAMVTGMYPATIGAHNHRSQNLGDKAAGNTAFYDSYRLGAEVPLVPRLLKQAGYYTTLGRGPACQRPGKTDYNFLYDQSIYDGADWKQHPEGQPFFGQIMLQGGKNRRARHHGADPAAVTLPPYYPDHPVLRRDWADYLNSWMEMDQQVGQIMSDLAKSGAARETVVFFWTDHGVSHMRGKQFLYDEGILVPLIVWFGDGKHAATVRDDLVVHIDVAATSLALAGIGPPPAMQGRDLFAPDYQPRDVVFSARDRCDETVDVIRCARSERFKYIRNFTSDRPHAQANQYKDGKAIVQTMRALHAAGELDELQARVFAQPRPVEELYDLAADPLEIHNLAADPDHGETLRQMREQLGGWMIESGDLGLVPEAVLEELGRAAGNKSRVLEKSENDQLVRRLLDVIDAGQWADIPLLKTALADSSPAVRYWAVTWLAHGRVTEAIDQIAAHVNDSSPAVRVASTAALCRFGRMEHLTALADLVGDDNLVVGMLAMSAIEALGAEALPVTATARQALKSPYDSTRRIARRVVAQLEAAGN